MDLEYVPCECSELLRGVPSVKGNVEQSVTLQVWMHCVAARS